MHVESMPLPPFPGTAKVRTEMVFRSLGGVGTQERLCAGFMRKEGVIIDEKDRLFSTYALVYIISGKGAYIDHQGQKHTLSPGSYFQRIPGLRHSNFIDPDSGWLECFLDVGPELFGALNTMRVIMADPICGNIGIQPSLIHNFWQLKCRLSAAAEDELPSLLVDVLALLRDFLKHVRIQHDGDEQSRMVRRACQFFAENPHERGDLRQFCHAHGWGYERFRKVFAVRMGLSPSQYRIRRRLDIACQLLADPANTVADVAEALGYSSPYEFSAQFKRHHNVSPTEFRKGTMG